jgi:hypothetical protein
MDIVSPDKIITWNLWEYKATCILVGQVLIFVRHLVTNNDLPRNSRLRFQNNLQCFLNRFSRHCRT